MRFEKKFVMPGQQRLVANLIETLLISGFFKQHPIRRVNSIYLSHLSMNDFTDHLQGESERKKERLRWYGDLDSDNYVTFEAKHRKLEMGYKSRHRTTLSPQVDGSCESIWRLVERFRSWCIGNKVPFDNGLIPSILVYYERRYFYHPVDDTRVTIDLPVFYCPVNRTGPMHKIRESDCVVEVKSEIFGLENFQKAMQSNSLTLSKNSKFINGIKKCYL